MHPKNKLLNLLPRVYDNNNMNDFTLASSEFLPFSREAFIFFIPTCRELNSLSIYVVCGLWLHVMQVDI